jgi:nitroreductase
MSEAQRSEAIMSTKENIEEIQKKFNLSDAEYLSLAETEFRARFRERLHHTMEIQVYHAAYYKKTLNDKQTETALRLLALWDKRGLSHELPDYVYAQKLLGFAKLLLAGQELNLSDWQWHILTPGEQTLFDQVIYERRSVRHWAAERVPEEVVRKVLETGLWAAHSCNLQSIRYLVVREEKTPGLFVGADIPGGPVHLVLLQDERVYAANPLNPVRNRLLDCGAAAQNIVLAAHAYGLGGVWLTFTEAMKERLRNHFDLPAYLSVVTYVDVGWPDQTPYPPQRISVEEALLTEL